MLICCAVSWLRNVSFMIALAMNVITGCINLKSNTNSNSNIIKYEYYIKIRKILETV